MASTGSSTPPGTELRMPWLTPGPPRIFKRCVLTTRCGMTLSAKAPIGKMKSAANAAIAKTRMLQLDSTFISILLARRDAAKKSKQPDFNRLQYMPCLINAQCDSPPFSRQTETPMHGGVCVSESGSMFADSRRLLTAAVLCHTLEIPAMTWAGSVIVAESVRTRVADGKLFSDIGVASGAESRNKRNAAFCRHCIADGKVFSAIRQ